LPASAGRASRELDKEIIEAPRYLRPGILGPLRQGMAGLSQPLPVLRIVIQIFESLRDPLGRDFPHLEYRERRHVTLDNRDQPTSWLAARSWSIKARIPNLLDPSLDRRLAKCEDL